MNAATSKQATAKWPAGVTYEQMIAAGWTEALMVQEGYLADPAPQQPALEAAQAAEVQDDLRKLAEAEDELYTAQSALATADRPGNEDAAHECRKWVTQCEREVRLCRERLGALAPKPDPKLGTYVTSHVQRELFNGFVYVNDIHRIVSPSGFLMNEAKFDAHPRFAGRDYQMNTDGTRPSRSAWEAFVSGHVSQGVKVHGVVFKPTEPPGAIMEIEGERFVNTWRPVNIRMVPGDVTPFLNHLKVLYPSDWRVLLNYLKFMMQHKGRKATWWPFLQGTPGNGKSFISDTMEYCIGYKFTQRPTPKNIDGEFNASLYGCLFLALEDVRVADDDHGRMWDTIKPMVTQTRLEIQPKGVDKITREVCFNAIINSNFKNGIRKTADDRRIAPFFSAQQRKGDLVRDGLTEQYFRTLWEWSKGNDCAGWSHVAYYLTHEPIDEDFNAEQCPITSSTAEAIRVGRTPAEQEIGDALESHAPGFRGGWVNMHAVDNVLRAQNLRHIGRQARIEIIEALGYIPHPALPRGRLTMPLNDGTMPVLYILPDHPWAVMHVNAAQIRDAYQYAQQQQQP